MADCSTLHRSFNSIRPISAFSTRSQKLRLVPRRARHFWYSLRTVTRLKRRSLIGAHYTSEQDILLLIDPVLMRPLQERWAHVKVCVLEALEAERAERTLESGSRQIRLRTDRKSEKLLGIWIENLTAIRVLEFRLRFGKLSLLGYPPLLDLWLEARDRHRARHFPRPSQNGLSIPTLWDRN